MGTKVKICGVTRVEDAEMVVQAGAWAVGMIFYDGSPRRCSIDEALAISGVVRRKALLCGVFVNEELERIARLVDELSLDLVQLHGDEGPSFCSEVARRSGVRIVKATQVAGPGDVRDLKRFRVDYHLLDSRPGSEARQGLRGGTGETFDWSLLAARRSTVPLILSGGITAGNAGEAIAAVHPFAVDSASGTESSPGHKDADKVAALIAAVQAADAPDGDAPAQTTIGQPA